MTVDMIININEPYIYISSGKKKKKEKSIFLLFDLLIDCSKV